MLADIIGGWEIVLIISLVLILFGGKRGPDVIRGLLKGLKEFWSEWGRFTPIDRDAHEAGRSIGGIFGKRATEALTPHNQVAELYNPGALETHAEHRRPSLFIRFSKWLRKCALRIVHGMGRSI